jgi:hypothetical protein
MTRTVEIFDERFDEVEVVRFAVEITSVSRLTLLKGELTWVTKLGN